MTVTRERAKKVEKKKKKEVRILAGNREKRQEPNEPLDVEKTHSDAFKSICRTFLSPSLSFPDPGLDRCLSDPP